MSAAERFARGLAALGLDLPRAVQETMLAYLALLAKWNRAYNLTAVRQEQAMVGQHLLDSLAVLPHLEGESLADVGSGAGLPGVPLAIARPGWRVALVESNQKKAAFLEQVRIEFRLDNLQVVRERVEAYRPDEPYAVVIARAFSDLAEFVRLSAHLVAVGGMLAAMKGIYPYEELAGLPSGFVADRVVALDVPETEGTRHLVLIRRN